MACETDSECWTASTTPLQTLASTTAEKATRCCWRYGVTKAPSGSTLEVAAG